DTSTRGSTSTLRYHCARGPIPETTTIRSGAGRSVTSRTTDRASPLTRPRCCISSIRSPRRKPSRARYRPIGARTKGRTRSRREARLIVRLYLPPALRSVLRAGTPRVARMAHVILGLLLIAPQSLYDLVKSFEAGVSLFYSASSGSIKRALDGLLAQGLIEVASVEPSARGKKVYRVTDSGREEFRSWMTGELAGPDLETAALPRLFFLGLLAPA